MSRDACRGARAIAVAAVPAIVAVVVGAACGPAPEKAVVQLPRPIPSIDVGGEWAWSNESVKDGVRRVETERWSLAMDGDDISGRYRRRVVFSDETGGTFACSQSGTFALETQFTLRGTRDGASATITETAATASPSPCSRGKRVLGAYVVRREGDALVVVGDSGEQRLALITEKAAAPEPAPALDGTWSWSTRSRSDSGVTRLERETWQLATASGEISGTYTRTVTVSIEGDKPLPCAPGAETSLTFVDRYTIAGWIRPTGIEIAEQSVDPASHPCLDGETRHLDVARGSLAGDLLVLRWRNQRRQVLSRTIP